MSGKRTLNRPLRVREASITSIYDLAA